MKKRNLIFLLFYFWTIVSIGQGLTNHWLMGYNSQAGPPFGGTNLDFIGSSLNISYINRSMDFSVTNGEISDSIGNLLFYTNGIYIANSQNNTMLNGGGLNPGQFTNNYLNGMPLPQGNIIIPLPNTPGKYYLFHETCTHITNLSQPFELFYSIIDMSLDSGLGGVVSKNINVFQDTLEWGELSATKHANGRDWWLLCHKAFSDRFYKLLITPYGITISTQDYGTFRNNYGGTSAFSPDGFKFAHYNSSTDLDIYDFDRCTGMLSNYINIPINDSALFGNVAFSPNSKILYASSTKYVYQFDVTSTNIASTMLTVAVWDGFYSPGPPFATTFLFAQLGSDAKMYINCGNGTLKMHAINFPDSLGLACDLQQHSINLPTYNAFTIPNHPNYFLGSIPGSPCDSLTPVAEIKNNTIPIRINPNPAQNTFYLNYQLPYGKTAIATVYNTLGQAVMRKSLYWYFGYLEIDCSGLENGVYVVKVETKGYLGSGKLVIAR